MDEKSIEKLILRYTEQNQKLENTKKVLTATQAQIEIYESTFITGCDLVVVIPLAEHLNKAKGLIIDALVQINTEQKLAKIELAQQIKEICAS